LTVAEKEEESTKQSPKRALKVATTKLFEAATKALGNDDCYNYGDDWPSPTSNPTPNPTPNFEKLVAQDGVEGDAFGSSCSIYDDIFVIGAPNADNYIGAAYVFDHNGNEMKKLTPFGDGETFDEFGSSVSIDEKIVVGTGNGDYVNVFSLEGDHERTITCDECTCLSDDCSGMNFGHELATHGEKVVVSFGSQLRVYNITNGELLKVLWESHDNVFDVAISNKYIVSTYMSGFTRVHSNLEPDFPKIVEIPQGGTNVAVSGDRLVIGNKYANDHDGAVYLYRADGTWISNIYRGESGSYFGGSVEITEDKVLVGAYPTWSVFIYSAYTGNLIEKRVSPNYNPWAGGYEGNVCASDSHYIVGDPFEDEDEGAAYLFSFP